MICSQKPDALLQLGACKPQPYRIPRIVYNPLTGAWDIPGLVVNQEEERVKRLYPAPRIYGLRLLRDFELKMDLQRINP